MPLDSDPGLSAIGMEGRTAVPADWLTAFIAVLGATWTAIGYIYLRQDKIRKDVEMAIDEFTKEFNKQVTEFRVESRKDRDEAWRQREVLAGHMGEMRQQLKWISDTLTRQTNAGRQRSP